MAPLDDELAGAWQRLRAALRERTEHSSAWASWLEPLEAGEQGGELVLVGPKLGLGYTLDRYGELIAQAADDVGARLRLPGWAA